MSNQRHVRHRKASSPVVAGALFLAAMLIVFNALFLVSSQYGSFFGDSLAKMRSDHDQRTEQLSVLKMSINSQKLNLTLTNQGPLTIHLVSIWISEWNGSISTGHVNRPLNVYIEPGQTAPGIGSDLQGVSFNAALTYAMRIVTDRGSVFPITYSPLSWGVSPGFINIGFLTISFDPTSFRYTQGSSCTPVPAWDVPGTSDDIVWQIQVTNHGSQDIKLYEWSSMTFIRITSTKTSSSFNQETFFVVGPNSCHASQVYGYNVVSNPYIIPRDPQNDTQKGGTPTWVWFAAPSHGDGDTQHITWNAPSEYMIFMVFYFLYGQTELYTQVIPFAGVNFT